MDSTAHFIQRIDLLQKKIDSLGNVITLKEINFKLNDQVDVINKVNQFYNTSWSNLMWVLTSALAIIGVIIPLVISYYQNRKFKTITTKQIAGYDTKIEELKKYNDEQIALKAKDVEWRAEAIFYDLQSMVKENEKDHFNAFRYGLKACEFNLRIKDEIRAKISMGRVLKNLYEIKTKTELDEMKNRNRDYKLSLDRVIEVDKTFLLRQQIEKIEKYILELE